MGQNYIGVFSWWVFLSSKHTCTESPNINFADLFWSGICLCPFHLALSCHFHMNNIHRRGDWPCPHVLFSFGLFYLTSKVFRAICLVVQYCFSYKVKIQPQDKLPRWLYIATCDVLFILLEKTTKNSQSFLLLVTCFFFFFFFFCCCCCYIEKHKCIYPGSISVFWRNSTDHILTFFFIFPIKQGLLFHAHSYNVRVVQCAWNNEPHCMKKK